MEDWAMTCIACGGAMKTTRENVKYDASGLPGVTLMNVEVRRCPACGETEYVIPDIEGLHRSLAYAIIRKPALLAPVEIRFLRKFLGWSGADFAKYMGTTVESVSRWENDKLSMSPPADRLLRMMVASTSPVQDYALETLTHITPRTTTKPLRMGVTRGKSGWTAKAA
jgi:putative zinc finger/helix-turn-helix YgiT family protein